MPRAGDSGDPESSSHVGRPGAAFRQANGVGIRNDETFSELNLHGLLPRCVRFAPASHPANGNTRFRPARYGSSRVGLAPTGFH